MGRVEVPGTSRSPSWLVPWLWFSAPRRADEGDPRFVLAAALLVGVHLGLVVYFFGSEFPIRTIPFSGGDFATHASQVRHTLAGLETAGQHWVYDVHLLAGAPNGVLFDADNKAWELWTWAWVRAGVHPGHAYNGFVLLIHVAMPLSLYASARLFELERWAALMATTLGVGLWFFDSFAHWIWFVGAVSYAFVAYLALLPLALMYRWLESRRVGYALGVALSLGLVHLIHPYAFFILVAPMVALYVRAIRERALGPREHGVVFAIVGFTILVNAWWLVTALRFFHYILDSAYYEHSGLRFFVYDNLGLLVEWTTQGMIGPRTGFRLIALVVGVAGLWSWRREADRRLLPIVVLIVTMALLTYLSGHTPAEQIQPYRHALPLGFALLIPAGAFLSETMGRQPWRALTRGQRVLALVLMVLAGQLLIRDALYFFTPSMPATQAIEDGGRLPMNSLGHAATLSYRYDSQEDREALVALVVRRDEGRGRWLVQDSVVGEYLMARTDAQILGGFRVRNIEHSDANWFRREGPPPYDLDALRDYIETYAVRWIVIKQRGLDPFWDSHPELLTRAEAADGFLVYKVHVDVALLEGRGRVRAAVNRIEVSGTQPDEDVVLRYHWMETLRCEPECTMVREPLPDDRVGFIRVPAPHPAEFAIVNRYQW